jgi:hypothetical protein
LLPTHSVILNHTVLTNYIHSETMNCADDFEKMLLSISTFKATSNIMLASDVGQDGLMERKTYVVENCGYHEKTFPEVNAFIKFQIC